MFLDNQSVRAAIAPLTLPHTYISGRLTVDPLDRADIRLHSSKQSFQPMQLSGEGVELESASPGELLAVLGDAFVTGNLIVRTIHVQP